MPTDETTSQVSRAAQDVIAERRRQVEVEGFTPEQDDQYRRSELLEAAHCYVGRRADARIFGYRVDDYPAPARWPWARSWWKPKDERSDLVRAAALLIAEIERLDRAEGATNG